jgi:Flp pilus assembly protein TadD
MTIRATLIALALASIVAAAPAAAQPIGKEHAEALKHLRLGQENLRTEKWDKAQTEFKEAIRLDPLLELAHYGLGQAHMGLKQFDRAVAAYIACRDVFHAQAGRAASSQMENEQRIVEQIQQLQDQKTQLQAKNFTGSSSLAAGALNRIDMMITELQSRRNQTADAAPRTPTWISIALGSAYFRSGAMADAEREYREAVAVDPKLGEAHNNLAVVYMLTQRFADADAEIKAAEKSGFRVNPQLKEDLKKAAARR